jgi:lysylphosphatidylglycerol synthetase-like protein (DUF2156 family)
MIDEPRPMQMPNTSPPPQHKLGLVGHVRVVAVLMIVQGVLQCLAAFMFVLGGIGGIVEIASKKHPTMGSEQSPVPIIVVIGSIAVFLLISGVLLIVAGITNLKYRGRVLGIVALCVAALSIISCYCAPTAIGLLIYGLIVFLNEDVRRAFELGKQGATSEEILKSFHG